MPLDVQINPAADDPTWVYVSAARWAPSGALLGLATVLTRTTADGLTWARLEVERRLRAGVS
ncbi:MAG TPA: hypothetical protein VIY73_10365 [Polyangiaceae bacterium]